jgi:hypothetical protein
VPCSNVGYYAYIMGPDSSSIEPPQSPGMPTPYMRFYVLYDRRGSASRYAGFDCMGAAGRMNPKSMLRYDIKRLSLASCVSYNLQIQSCTCDSGFSHLVSAFKALDICFRPCPDVSLHIVHVSKTLSSRSADFSAGRTPQHQALILLKMEAVD